MRRLLKALGCGRCAPRIAWATIAQGLFEVTRREAELRKMLSATKHAVMREGDTEQPYASDLLDEAAGSLTLRPL